MRSPIAMPDATPVEILEAGLELLLAQAAKRRGLVDKPQEKIRPAKGDHIPAHVRREVWTRDGGRCQYPLASGGICGATRHLELDHIRPKSLGGASTADNLRVVCRGHNDLAAVQAGTWVTFCAGHMGDTLLVKSGGDVTGQSPLSPSSLSSRSRSVRIASS